MRTFDVLIVGAGHAGAQTAISLRQSGFVGTVGLAGEEPESPYERPPLSKEYLAGEKNFARLLIRQPEFWDSNGIVLLHGRKVVEVDPQSQCVTTSASERIGYRQLVWAAGGAPRRLNCPGTDALGVFVLRNRADADQMMAWAETANRVVVVGGGYIGLETAATLTARGLHVTLVECADRVLSRVTGRHLPRFLEAEHRAHGVELLMGAQVSSIEHESGKVSGVGLAGGGYLPADMVVVGIGISPCVEPLLAAGADGGDGVRVDARCRTSIPGILAVGDCASHPNAFAGGQFVRLESVQNATDQAMTAAGQIMGNTSDYRSLPWFWSRQYDLRVQSAGLPAGHDLELVRGEPGARSFSVLYLQEQRLIAIDCVNAPKDYAHARAIIKARHKVDPQSVQDATVALSDTVVVGEAC